MPLYTLDPVDADEPLSTDEPALPAWKRIKRAYPSEASIWASWSIAPFYIALLLVGLGVLIVVIS